MENYKVTGYKMMKNEDTLDMEKTGDLMTVSVFSAKNSVEMIEGNVANKMGFDWFEAICIEAI
jgi:hypothetical protein